MDNPFIEDQQPEKEKGDSSQKLQEDNSEIT